MKIEATISCRAELPENVRRTVASLREAGIDSVRIVEDAPPMGCGYRRDEMICASTADAVFICDGHMAFSPGYFDRLREHLVANPTSLSCTRMHSLRHDWTPNGDSYCGADVYIKPFCGSLQYPIAAKWRKENTGPGKIGAVMGACYGLTRDWYHSIGRPLSILRAWGLDEEVLSIATWLSGGTVDLIDGEASHIYAAPHTRSARTEAETGAIFGNHLAMLAALPIPDEERVDLASVLTPILDMRMALEPEEPTIRWRRDPVWANSGGYIKRLVNDSLDERRRDIERLSDALIDGPWGWETYRNSMTKTQTEDEMKKEQSGGRAKAAADAARKQTAKPSGSVVACRHCGANGRHLELHTYPGGAKRYKCSVCEKPFIVTAGG